MDPVRSIEFLLTCEQFLWLKNIKGERKGNSLIMSDNNISQFRLADHNYRFFPAEKICLDMSQK